MASETAPLGDIAAAPAADQHISHEGKEYSTVKEGLAYILVPASGPKVPQKTPNGNDPTQQVFYNPIQQFNRDLSVLAIKAYGEEVIEAKRKKVEILRARFREKNKVKKKRKREAEVPDTSACRADGRPEEPPPVDVTENTVPQQDSAEKTDGTTDTVIPMNDDVVMEDSSATLHQTTQNGTDAHGSAAAAEPQAKQAETAPLKVPFTILDALSATGLRALRYVQEIPFTTSVTANDLLPEATKTIKLNIKHNKLEDKITAITGNALVHMYGLVAEDVKDGRSKKYDVIDLDPYGTAAPFLDAAIQAVRDDGGLLCVTCTDAGVWASNGYPEKSFSLYGGVTMKGPASHEAGIRLILHSIATTAAKHGIAIEPLLSLSIDFYARVFVRVYKSPSDVKFLAGKTMMVYNCDTGCGAWTTQMVSRNKLSKNKNGEPQWKHVYSQGPTGSEKCKHCGFRTHISGPMYGGPIHSPDFIKRILATLPEVSKDTYRTTSRIEGMLTLALEECLPDLDADLSPTAQSKTGKPDPAAIDPTPFFFIPSSLAKVVHCITPVENEFKGALRHLGYRVTRSHAKPGSIKTDAPWEVIWEVTREWVKQKAPIKEGAIRKTTAGWTIMGLIDKHNPEASVQAPLPEPSPKAEKIEVVFDAKLGAEKGNKKLVRYQANPRENWGPMARASGR